MVVTGLVQTTWVLLRLRQGLQIEPPVTFAWNVFTSRQPSLLIWEAFVSRSSKASTHHGDAALAVEAFTEALPNPEEVTMIDEPQVFSVVGAALLRAGWNVSTDVLSSDCLVVKV